MPPPSIQEALAIGAIPPDGEDPGRGRSRPTTPADPAERAPLILAAIEVGRRERARQLHCSLAAPPSALCPKPLASGAGEGIATVWQQWHDKVAADKAAE